MARPNIFNATWPNGGFVRPFQTGVVLLFKRAIEPISVSSPIDEVWKIDPCLKEPTCFEIFVIWMSPRSLQHFSWVREAIHEGR